MIISNITPPQVWAASSRSLTNIGSGALAPSDTIFTVLAAATNVDLRSSAGIVGQMTVSVQTGSAPTAAITIQLADGTNQLVLAVTAIASFANASASSVTTNSVGPRLSNADAAVGGRYMVAAYVFTI